MSTGLISIQIGIVEDCNRRCKFCGVTHLSDQKMTIDLAKEIAEQIREVKTKIKIDISSWGEQWMHPKFLDIVKIFADTVEDSYIKNFTNYDFCTFDKVLEYYEAGGEFLCVDCYTKRDLDRIEKEIQDYGSELETRGIGLVRYGSGKDTDFNMYYHHGKKRYFVIIDCSVPQSGVRKRNTMGGSVQLSKEQAQKYGVETRSKMSVGCARPMREIAIKPDGTVPLCCNDAKNDIVLGKLPEDRIKDILNTELLKLTCSFLRYGVEKKKRFFSPCYECTYQGGGRLGLEHPGIPNFNDVDVAREKLYEEVKSVKERLGLQVQSYQEFCVVKEPKQMRLV